jgi:hypothetical protein
LSRRLALLLVAGGVAAALLAALVGRQLLVPSPAARPRTLAVEPDCDAARAPCTALGEGLRLRLALHGEVVPMQPFEVHLEVAAGPPGGEAVAITGATVDFDMVGMDMGQNRYRLQAGDGGRWTARVTLPACVRGRRNWIARVAVATAAAPLVANFPFTTR